MAAASASDTVPVPVAVQRTSESIYEEAVAPSWPPMSKVEAANVGIFASAKDVNAPPSTLTFKVVAVQAYVNVCKEPAENVCAPDARVAPTPPFRRFMPHVCVSPA